MLSLCYIQNLTRGKPRRCCLMVFLIVHLAVSVDARRGERDMYSAGAAVQHVEVIPDTPYDARRCFLVVLRSSLLLRPRRYHAR
jgi:hypothetical protein